MTTFRGYIAGWVGYNGQMRDFKVTFHPFGRPEEKRTETVKALYAISAMNKIKRKHGAVACSVNWGKKTEYTQMQFC
jgi:hypothetical protein